MVRCSPAPPWVWPSARRPSRFQSGLVRVAAPGDRPGAVTRTGRDGGPGTAPASESVLLLLRRDGSFCSHRVRVTAPQRSGRIFLAGEMTGCCGAGRAPPPRVSPPTEGLAGRHFGAAAPTLPGHRGIRPFHGGPECSLLGPRVDRIGRPGFGNRNRPWPRLGVAGGCAVGQQSSGRPGAKQLRRQFPVLSMSAARLGGSSGGSSGVACHGAVQLAEGLLDAGFELARTLAAVPAWRGWLGQPCPGLVGGRAGLVALGAVEAIVRVWLWGVGHGDHPGARSGRRAEVGGTLMRQPEQLYLLPPAGSSRPAGDVISRQIPPGIYGERCTAVAEGRSVSEAGGD
jgi:hypothetical protein